MKNLFVIMGFCLILAGCGTFTGIPSHGGGKRFAIEQELISASARAAAKALDVSVLEGKSVHLIMISIGDQGSGNLVGGRYNLQFLMQGGYVNSPSTIASNSFPTVTNTSTSDTGGIITTTSGTSVLNFPSKTKTETDGFQANATGGASYSGLGSYQSEAFLNTNDVSFLETVLAQALILKGVIPVLSPKFAAQADATLLVTVDVFGTHRSRFDSHIFNKEQLMAKTAVHVMAFDKNMSVIVKPAVYAYEAKYTEKFSFWVGPYEYEKSLRKSDPLLVDFTDMKVPKNKKIKKSFSGEAFISVPMKRPNVRTRSNELTKPLSSPDPSRPEDVK